VTVSLNSKLNGQCYKWIDKNFPVFGEYAHYKDNKNLRIICEDGDDIFMNGIYYRSRDVSLKKIRYDIDKKSKSDKTAKYAASKKGLTIVPRLQGHPFTIEIIGQRKCYYQQTEMRFGDL
jgi:hypothetical protein